MQDESIQSKGGKARAEKLSPEQLAEIAKKAATARWANRPLKATHKGSFQNDFGIDVECYVLDDPQKTPVLSQRGFGKAIGLSEGGAKLTRFLASKQVREIAGPELLEKFAQPLKFQWGSGGPDMPPTTVHGYDAALLIDLCQCIVEADRRQGFRQKRVADQAQTILSASAKNGIRGLVYALAGYRPEVEEVIAAFKTYVLEEAKKYEKEFPNELYEEWHRLYDIPVPDRGKPWQFKHLTVKHIYYPLAQSSGKILELVRATKANGGDRKKKLFQFLSEVGTRALRIHLGRVLEMAESSPDKQTYERKTVERFGGQKELDLGLT